MADRSDRIRIFSETMELCQSNPALCKAVRDSKANQKITWEEDPLNPAVKRHELPAELVLTPERNYIPIK